MLKPIYLFSDNMSVANTLWGWVTGEDLNAIEARDATNNAKLAELNRKNVESGKWSQSQYYAVQARQMEETSQGTIASQVTQAAGEGAKEGLNTLVDTVGEAAQSVTNWSFKSLFKLVPWQVWPILAIVAFFYLGGGVLLKGALAKHARK